MKNRAGTTKPPTLGRVEILTNDALPLVSISLFGFFRFLWPLVFNGEGSLMSSLPRRTLI